MRCLAFPEAAPAATIRASAASPPPGVGIASTCPRQRIPHGTPPTTWALAREEATRRKGGAVESLINSGMKAAEVAELLGIEGKELRTLRAAAPNSNPNNGSGPGASDGENPNGS